jgi:hypothetical protein
MQRERVLESFLQTSRGAGIDAHEFVLDLLKGSFRFRITGNEILEALENLQIEWETAGRVSS